MTERITRELVILLTASQQQLVQSRLIRLVRATLQLHPAHPASGGITLETLAFQAPVPILPIQHTHRRLRAAPAPAVPILCMLIMPAVIVCLTTMVQSAEH